MHWVLIINLQGVTECSLGGTLNTDVSGCPLVTAGGGTEYAEQRKTGFDMCETQVQVHLGESSRQTVMFLWRTAGDSKMFAGVVGGWVCGEEVRETNRWLSGVVGRIYPSLTPSLRLHFLHLPSPSSTFLSSPSSPFSPVPVSPTPV